MNQKDNINIDPNYHAQLPRVSISYWRYYEQCWKAYQLPNGALFMSDRQMALFVGQPKKIVRSFVDSLSLETLSVQIDNGVEVQVYPLSVAAIYLSTLLKMVIWINILYYFLVVNGIL